MTDEERIAKLREALERIKQKVQHFPTRVDAVPNLEKGLAEIQLQ